MQEIFKEVPNTSLFYPTKSFDRVGLCRFTMANQLVHLQATRSTSFISTAQEPRKITILTPYEPPTGRRSPTMSAKDPSQLAPNTL